MINDEEKQHLKSFWENQGQRDAVFKVLNQNFEINPNYDRPNELIGQEVRALWRGKQMVIAAFQEIEQYQTSERSKSNINIAR